jgi:uncharacterized protein
MHNRWNRVRTHAAALTLLFGAALAAPACTPAPVPATLETGAAAGYLPLWEITQGSGTVHLLGSVHLLRPEVYPLDSAIYEAFDAADVVVFELDFAEMAAAAPMLIQRGMFDDGRTLRDVLPEATLADLERRVERLGLPMAMVERMKPWMVAMTLTTMVLQQSGYDASTGIDLHFHERAVSAGKEVVGLETMEYQIGVFDRLDTQAQVAFLESTLEQLDDTVSEMDRATALWQAGDAPGLAEMFVESMDDQPALMEALLYRRNQAWVGPIRELIARPGHAIVIVGMGHLVGDGSVIDLLRGRGVAVTQIRSMAPAP